MNGLWNVVRFHLDCQLDWVDKACLLVCLRLDREGSDSMNGVMDSKHEWRIGMQWHSRSMAG